MVGCGGIGGEEGGEGGRGGGGEVEGGGGEVCGEEEEGEGGGGWTRAGACWGWGWGLRDVMDDLGGFFGVCIRYIFMEGRSPTLVSHDDPIENSKDLFLLNQQLSQPRSLRTSRGRGHRSQSMTRSPDHLYAVR